MCNPLASQHYGSPDIVSIVRRSLHWLQSAEPHWAIYPANFVKNTHRRTSVLDLERKRGARNTKREGAWVRPYPENARRVRWSHTPPESVYMYTQACKLLYEMLRLPIGYHLQSGSRSAGLGVADVISIINGKRVCHRARMHIHSILSFHNSRSCLASHSPPPIHHQIMTTEKPFHRDPTMHDVQQQR